MSQEQAAEGLIGMTAEIVATYVANNAVGVGDVGGLIRSVHASLSLLGRVPEPADERIKPTGAVTARRSLADPAHILSMIDGKPYKMLTRHIARNGYTPESYRAAFGLPRDYPMAAADYAEVRRKHALRIGLGRKPKEETEVAPNSTVRRGGKVKEEKAPQPTEPARRGRKPRNASTSTKGRLSGGKRSA